jgi:hypothetical protein
MQGMALSLVLDPRRLGGVDHAARDGDEPASEKTERGLPVLPVHGKGGVAPNAPPDVNGKRVAEFLFVEAVGARRDGAEGHFGRFPHQPAVRSAVVVLVEESVEADVEIVERGERAAEVQAALAERAPEALHFSARGGVVGLGVHQGGADAGARQGEGAPAVGGPVIQVESIGRGMFAHSAHEQAEHVDLALLVHGLEDDDVAGGVVHEGVDAHGFLFATGGDQVRAVADIAVPEGAGALGLPAQALLGVRPLPQGASIEAARAEQAAHSRGGDGVLVDAPLEYERVDDELGRSALVFATDVAYQLLLLGGERPGGPSVRARLGAQRREPPFSVQPVPTLERRHGEGARRAGAGWPEPLLAEGLEAGAELAARQVEARERADDLAAEQGNLLGVILGGERLHEEATFPRPPSLGRRTTVATRAPCFCRGIAGGGTHRIGRSGSRKVPSGAGERRRVGGEPGGSEGHKRGSGALGMLAPHKACRRGARGAEQPSRSSVGGPPSQRYPASLGCRADDRERADPRARFRLGRAHQGPHRQGQSDRTRGVQPPRQKLPRHRDHARAAPLTLEAAYAHGAQLRRRRRTRGAAHLTLARAVAVNDEGCAVRSTRGAAPQAARGPSLRGRWHLRLPRLDVEQAPVNPLLAPLLQLCRSTTRRMVPSKIPPSRRPFVRAGIVAAAPPPGGSPTTITPATSASRCP